MNDRTISHRLNEQLPHRRSATEQGHVNDTTRQIRNKDTFWVGAVLFLFLSCVLITGLGYFITLQLDLFPSERITQIQDPRWGEQYNKIDAPITSMIANDELIFVGTEGNGLHEYDKTTQIWHTYRRGYQQYTIPDDAIRWIKFDESKSNRAWALTKRGGTAFLNDSSNAQWTTLFGATPFSGLQEGSLITADRSGELIAVGTRNQGVGIYDLRQRVWVSQLRETSQPAMPSDHIEVVRAGIDEGTFWIGTQKGIAHIEGPVVTSTYLTDSPYAHITDLELNGDKIWYLTKDHVSIGQINQNKIPQPLMETTPLPISIEEVTSAAQHNQALWLGTQNQGIHRYNIDSHTWSPLRIPLSDSTSVSKISALVYNPQSAELLVSHDQGLHIIKEEQATQDSAEDTLLYPLYADVKKFQVDGNQTYFITDEGKVGIHQGNEDSSQDWWQFLQRRDQTLSDVATLVDLSSAQIDPKDISAACQSDEYLYFGTIHGDIVWYHKPTHAWSAIDIPLPFGIDELVYNQFTGSTVAISGNALYRSPPTLDVFILYLSLSTSEVKITPTPKGYLIFINDTQLAHFDESTNHKEMLLEGNEATVAAFEPVAMDQVGALLYFVTKSGRVLSYDTLTHKWDTPAEIPNKDVTDIRGLGYRTIYQTAKNALFVSGSATLIGEGTTGLSDEQIKHAAADINYVWVAGNGRIETYEKSTHTWLSKRKLNIPSRSPPTHMVPLHGKIAYRTGPEGAGGTLWVEKQQVDRGVYEVSGVRDHLWYLKNNGLYRINGRAYRPRRVLSKTGISRLSGERIVSATEANARIWLATNHRILSYHTRLRTWGQNGLPGGKPAISLQQAANTVYATSTDALFQLTMDNQRWVRISPSNQRVRKGAISSTGATLLMENGHIQHIPISRNPGGQTPTFQLTPNKLNIPVHISEILAAHQNMEQLTIVTSNYIHTYNTHTHRWAQYGLDPSFLLSKAVIQNNTLWATTTDNRTLTGPLNTTSIKIAITTDTLPLSVQNNLNSNGDQVFIDTPFWKWERIQNVSTVLLKAHDGTTTPLSDLTGQSFTGFPFDQIRDITHNGVDIWLAVDMGMIRFPHTSHGDIGKFEWFRTGTPSRVEYIRSPTRENKLICEIAGITSQYYEFNPDDQVWLPLSLSADETNPFENSILIQTPLWQWTAENNVVTANFNAPELRGQSVFAPDNSSWRFRFDDIKGLLTLNQDIFLVADGLLSQYVPSDSTLSLDGLTLSRGPSVHPDASVELTTDDAGNILIAVKPPQTPRKIFRSTQTERSKPLEPYPSTDDPFRFKALINDGAWRWELDRRTGLIRKFIKTVNNTQQDFTFVNGRFGFDNFQSFTVVGDQVWLATTAGIARYPMTGSTLPLHALRLDSEIAGYNNPNVTRINIKNNTLYCNIEGQGTFARSLNSNDWRPIRQDETPWIRSPVSSPFWTWEHDLIQNSVIGSFRDANGNHQPVMWADGKFNFDNITDVVWHENALWMTSANGVISYPKNKAYLDIDSLKVYPTIPQADQLISVSTDRPAPAGLYTRSQSAIYRLDKQTNIWQPQSNDNPDANGYIPLNYLNDRFTYDILIDYDGFWRSRRRMEGENPRRTPSVILEAYRTGRWQPISMENGRFDFDIVRDFVVVDQTMWLATQAGICRYEIGKSWLDLRFMVSFWDNRFKNATDIQHITDGSAEHLVIRRGNNNNAILDIDLERLTTTPLSVTDSPFSHTMLVSTDYWRWGRKEQYRGSVASGFDVTVELKDEAGLWVPLSLKEQDQLFPFEHINDIAYYNNTLWATTPIGVFQYSPELPINISNSKFYSQDGQLEGVKRLIVNRSDGGAPRLICETGTGSSRQGFFLDNRSRWQALSGQITPDRFLFQEDEWYWYERDGDIQIRYQNDPSRLRLIYNQQFSDHYVQAITTDAQAIWTLTPSGLFRYASNEATPEILQNAFWYTNQDIIDVPANLRRTINFTDNSASKALSILKNNDTLWLLTSDEIVKYSTQPDNTDLIYKTHVNLPGTNTSAVDGHIYRKTDGTIALILVLNTDGEANIKAFTIDINTNQPVEDPLFFQYKSATSLPSIVAVSADSKAAWIASPSGLYKLLFSVR